MIGARFDERIHAGLLKVETLLDSGGCARPGLSPIIK
jgi:hypothetical protein